MAAAAAAAVNRFYNGDRQPAAASSPLSPAGNLGRFLESTAPVVEGRGGEMNAYFCLGDLWESFKEWSAYGAGVPLVLNGGDSVVQYYVPYVSAIQLYVDTHKPVSEFRDGNTCLDTSSEGTCEGDINKVREGSAGASVCIPQEGLASGDSEVPQKALPIFEYLERDPPYVREPLADKISILTSKFPELKTYKSCNLSSSSWMSVAWYPIYRIPTGPTLKDLDACFLTYHKLSTPKFDSGPRSHIPGSPIVSKLKFANAMSNKLTLPAFGLASYKFRGSIWTSDGLQERQLAGTLLQAADNWLRLLQVDHPDYRFFISHYKGFKR